MGKESEKECVCIYMCMYVYTHTHTHTQTSQVTLAVKNPPSSAGVRSLGQEDPLEKEMATQSSIFARRIPWTEEPRGLQSILLQRVGHD